MPDKVFDVVFSSEVLEHVFDVAGTLTEYHRLLDDGGKLVLTTPYHGVAKNVAIALKGYERHYHPYHGHIRFFTRRSLNDCLVDAGFEVKHWRGLGRIWPLWKTMFVIAEKA